MRNFTDELNRLEGDMLAEFGQLVRDIGGVSKGDNPEMEFFDLHVCDDQEIEAINSAGEVVGGFQDDVNISELVDSGNVSTRDLAVLLSDLKELL